MPRLVCISDTHLRHLGTDYPLPDGDLLLHAGDATRHGTPEEILQFGDWFASQPHAHKVFVAGNHDFGFEREPTASRALLHSSITYLQDSEATLAGLRIYGSPWQPRFFNWAFMLTRGEPLRDKWRQIPAGVDVLITHGPPHGVLDRTIMGVHAGCEDLADEVSQRVRPRLHLFGHIHEGHGELVRDGVHYVNASGCTVRYRLDNAPIVVDLEPA